MPKVGLEKRMAPIDLTDNIDIVTTVPDGICKIISLDEENRLNPKDPNVIVGTCLLPPTEALIAEVDGDEDLYNIHYAAYLNTPGVQDFVTAIIAALYNKIQLLVYAPQLHENESINKLMQFMWSLYGIGIGIVSVRPCVYDKRCIPIWLNMIYNANVITPEQFLKDYPLDAPINTAIMNKLVYDIKPVGISYDDRVKSIERFRKRIFYDNKVQMPIYDLRR